MDAIMWLVLFLASAWLAYTVVAAERRNRAWAGVTSVGVFLALFGTISYGLLAIWNNLLRPKLVDSLPGENTLLFVGILVVGGLVFFILELLGTIDVMSRIQVTMDRPKPGTPSGD